MIKKKGSGTEFSYGCYVVKSIVGSMFAELDDLNEYDKTQPKMLPTQPVTVKPVQHLKYI